MIDKVNSAIQIGEMGTLSKTVGARYDEYLAKLEGDRILSLVMAEEKAEAENIIVAINRTKSASRLEETDAKRDEALTTLFDTAKAYTVLGKADEKASAKSLCAIFNKYHNIAYMNNSNESAQILSMFKDLESESAKANLASLSAVSDAVEAVRVAEDNFLAEIKANEDQKIALGSNASSIKKRLVSILNDKLVPYLNVASAVAKEDYSPFADSVAILIKNANAVVNQRAKK